MQFIYFFSSWVFWLYERWRGFVGDPCARAGISDAVIMDRGVQKPQHSHSSGYNGPSSLWQPFWHFLPHHTQRNSCDYIWVVQNQFSQTGKKHCWVGRVWRELSIPTAISSLGTGTRTQYTRVTGLQSHSGKREVMYYRQCCPPQ